MYLRFTIKKKIGPRILARVAERTGLHREDLQESGCNVTYLDVKARRHKENAENCPANRFCLSSAHLCVVAPLRREYPLQTNYGVGVGWRAAGVRYMELIGVLLETKHRRLAPALKPPLDALRDVAGFRISNALSSVSYRTREKKVPHASFYRRHGKRALDLALTIPALIALSPVLLLIALLVRLTLGTPVLFRQQRPGRHGKPFYMVKFRTMTDARDAQGNLLSDAERLTPFGRFLRATSLDELPELWNVLKGDMSLVGPRPLLMQYLERYTPEQARRHEVRPGITGWAQVNGRNAISWEQKFAYDVWYVDNLSFWLDLKILALTVRKIIAHEGISQAGQATMEEFRGNER